MSFQFEHALIDSWKPEQIDEMIAGEIFIMQMVQINDDEIPAIEVVDNDGVPWQVLMSQYALQKVFYNPLVVEEGFLVIKYDGESKSIQKAGNFAKKFSVAYYAPGDWSYDDKGEFTGNPTRLRSSTKGTRPNPLPIDKPKDWKEEHREDDGKAFDPESPSSEIKAEPKRKKALSKK